MARRGRFGRRPRASGNLTALVAQLYREQRQAEDRAIFDAWQNGGMFQGKPVDDSRLRAYIIARRDGLKGDALYDEWNNRLIQIDFKIGEDKIQLAYQQGKASAGAVANYYRSQLSKIPKESAFYREVAGRAAQWSKAASAAARGSARRRLTGALDAKQNAVAKTWQDYTQLEAYITEAAKRAGLIAGNQQLVDADASRLLDFFSAGIPGPNGTTITFDDWQKASVAAYKAFDTQIAVNKQLNRGTKELTEAKGKFLSQNLVRINTVDDRAQYEAARETWEQAIEDAQGDPRAILEASKQYAQLLTDIAKNAAVDTDLNKNDPEFLGGLQNELSAVTTGKFTGPTVFDLQSTTTEAVTTRDGEGTASSITQAMADADALANGTAYYGQGEFGGKLGVSYFPSGSQLDPFGNKGLGTDTQPAILNINGKPTQVYLKGKPIQAKALVNANGEPIDSVPDGKGGSIPVANLSAAQVQGLLQSGAVSFADGEAQTVGYVFQQGNKVTYGVVDPTTGDLKFTNTNPFTSAFAPAGEEGFAVITGSGINDAGDIIATPPALNAGITGEGLFVDPTISPKDLRNLALNSPNTQEAQDYAALADQRQREAQAESDFMARSQGKERTQAGVLPGVARTVTSVLSDIIGAARQAASEANQPAPPNVSLSPPTFGGTKAPTLGAPPPVPAPTPAPGPAPSPSAPPPTPDKTGGSAVGSATWTAIQNAKDQTGGGAVGSATWTAIENAKKGGKGGGGTNLLL